MAAERSLIILVGNYVENIATAIDKVNLRNNSSNKISDLEVTNSHTAFASIYEEIAPYADFLLLLNHDVAKDEFPKIVESKLGRNEPVETHLPDLKEKFSDLIVTQERSLSR